jgi:UTP--glucose-1-phosphate uridylyltransferase
MKGLGHAILTGETLIGDEPFAVILADDLCYYEDDAVLVQMVKIYEKYQCCVVAIEEIDIEQSDKYGIIDGKLVDDSNDIYRVSHMVEKPSPTEAPTNMAIIGRYILTPEIFDVLRVTKAGRGGEIQITDALNSLAKEGKVIAYRFRGKRFDCGSVDGYVKATNYFYDLYKEQK